MGRYALALVVALVCVTPALGSDIGRKHQIDTKISSLQERLAAQKQHERGPPRPGRRLHGTDPRAGGEGRRRLAPAADARGRSRPAPTAARRAQHALPAPDGQVRLPAGAVRNRCRQPEPATRRHLRVRPGLDARPRARRAFDPGCARPGPVHERDRRAGSAHRRAGAVREAAGPGCAHEDEEAAGDRPGRDGDHLRTHRTDARRQERAGRRGRRPVVDEAEQAHRPVAS